MKNKFFEIKYNEMKLIDQSYICKCEGKYKDSTFSKHVETKKHIKFMNDNYIESFIFYCKLCSEAKNDEVVFMNKKQHQVSTLHKLLISNKVDNFIKEKITYKL